MIQSPSIDMRVITAQPASGSTTPRSPSMEHMVLEHAIDVDNATQKNKWSMCCSERKTDSRLLSFGASFIISFVLLIFSCYQLSISDSCESQQIYIPLISLIVGFWIKSPLE